MTISKKDISLNIKKKVNISNNLSLNILDSFLNFIKKNSNAGTIKISQFGSFKRKTSMSRMGRNPKTKEAFIIPKSHKLSFKSSSKVKSTIN